MSAVLTAAVPTSPPRPALGLPCRAPARTVRVGVVPRPRVRPLAEVLAALPRTPTPPDVTPERAPAGPDPRFDAVADAARPAAMALFGLVAEILDGRRAPTHLRALCDDDLYASIAPDLAPRRRSTTRGQVRTVRVCPVGPTTAEVTGVVHRDGRARAIAARLERGGRRGWRLRALRVL